MEEVLAKYFSDELTPAQREEVELWRGESEENAEEFLAFSKVWHTSAEVDSQSALNSVLSQIKEKGEQVEYSSQDDQKDPKLSNVFVHFFKIAAAVVVGVGLGYFALQQFGILDQEQHYASNDEKMEVTLGEGSIVTLAPHSELTFKNGEKKRSATLSGKAFFDVKRDESKVFEIQTDYSKVEVLGTSFMVNTTNASLRTEVVVETGSVAVTDRENLESEVTLLAGDRAYYERSSGEIVKVGNENRNYLAWKTNLISFDKQSLADVIAFLSDSYGVEIELANPNIANCLLSADFRDQNVQEILEVVSLTFSLELKKLSAKRFVLSGEGC